MANFEIDELIKQIVRTRKGITREFVISTLKDSIIYSIKKKKGQDYPVEVEIEPKRGIVQITVEKEVKKDVEDPDRDISVEEAKKYNPDIYIGAKVKVPVDLSFFGRGTVYKIQNLFLQRIREAEKQYIYKDFSQRIGEIIKGTIQKVDKTGVYVSLGNAEAILPPEEQIPGEKYKQGGDLKALILKVDESRRFQQVVLSRTHPDFLRRLVEEEVPEVVDGTVEVKAVARIPGKRAKVAVRSKNPKVDPVGACIGVKGKRIQTLVKQLSGEKIDVVRWSNNLLRFAANVLAPVDPLIVFEEDDHLVAVVKDEDIANAKGQDAQNVILASKLVGKEIYVFPLSEAKLPSEAVSLLELESLSEKTLEALRTAGKYVFKEVPSLAELLNIEGIDEQTAYKLLEEIESKLEEKKKNAK